MNNISSTFKLFKTLIKYYKPAKNAQKINDLNLKKEIMAKLSKDVLVNQNKQINIINEANLASIDGCIIISNHQATLDIFSIINLNLNSISFLAKKELFKIPGFKTFLYASNSYAIDRNDPRQGVNVLKKVVEDVNEKNANVVIFPEGTRSNAELMSDFNTGIFNILKRSKKPLVPIYIDKSYNRKSKFINIIIGKPIETSEFKSLNSVKLKELVYNKIIDLKINNIKNIKQSNFVTLGLDSTIYHNNLIKNINQQGMLKQEYKITNNKLDLKSIIDLLNNEVVLQKDNYLINDEISLNKIIFNADCLILNMDFKLSTSAELECLIAKLKKFNRSLKIIIVGININKKTKKRIDATDLVEYIETNKEEHLLESSVIKAYQRLTNE